MAGGAPASYVGRHMRSGVTELLTISIDEDTSLQPGDILGEKLLALTKFIPPGEEVASDADVPDAALVKFIYDIADVCEDK